MTRVTKFLFSMSLLVMFSVLSLDAKSVVLENRGIEIYQVNYELNSYLSDFETVQLREESKQWQNLLDLTKLKKENKQSLSKYPGYNYKELMVTYYDLSSRDTLNSEYNKDKFPGNKLHSLNNYNSKTYSNLHYDPGRCNGGVTV